MKRLIKFVCVSTFLTFFGATSAFAAVGATINDVNVNLRANASTTAEVLDRSTKGQAVTVLSASGDFYKVSTKDKQTVFVAKQFVDIKSTLGVVTSDGINLRKDASKTAEVVGSASQNEVFSVNGIKDGWYSISHNGKDVYISKDFLEGKKLATVKNLAQKPAEVIPVVKPVVKVAEVKAPVVAAAPKAVELPKTEVPKAIVEPKVMIPDLPTIEDNKAVISTIKEEISQVALPVLDASTVLSEEIIEIEKTFNEEIEKSESDNANEKVYARSVVITKLNLREQPSLDGKILNEIDSGEVFEVLEINGDWLNISFYGTNGFVSKDYVELFFGEKPEKLVIDKADLSRGQEIISYGKQFLGTSYVYGGTNLKSGVDCSGFVYSVMKNFGIQLNRSSRDMFSNGIKVSRDELQAGDLIFFAANGNTISHVAIYIGAGEYIHSTDAKGRGVSFANLNDAYSAKTYFGARRVIL